MAEKPFSSKLFYKIGEVCELTGVRPHILRYWESEFSALSPKKNRGGQRVYQKKDLEKVLAIKKMLYEEGYTIAGAKKKLSRGVPKDAIVKPADEHEGPPENMGSGASGKKDTPSVHGGPPEKGLADALGSLKEEIKDLLNFIG